MPIEAVGSSLTIRPSPALPPRAAGKLASLRRESEEAAALLSVADATLGDLERAMRDLMSPIGAPQPHTTQFAEYVAERREFLLRTDSTFAGREQTLREARDLASRRRARALAARAAVERVLNWLEEQHAIGRELADADAEPAKPSGRGAKSAADALASVRKDIADAGRALAEVNSSAPTLRELRAEVAALVREYGAAAGFPRLRLDSRAGNRLVVEGEGGPGRGPTSERSTIALLCWLFPEVMTERWSAQCESVVAGRAQTPRAERDARMKQLRKKIVRLEFQEEQLVIESGAERRLDADPRAILGVSFARLPPFEQRFNPSAALQSTHFAG